MAFVRNFKKHLLFALDRSRGMFIAEFAALTSLGSSLLHCFNFCSSALPFYAKTSKSETTNHEDRIHLSMFRLSNFLWPHKIKRLKIDVPKSVINELN